MKRLLLCACLLGGATSVPAADFTTWTGAELYKHYCASCHGKSGAGDGPVAPSLRAAPPDLTRIAQRHGGRFPDDWVYRVIDGREYLVTHGPRDMPVWGQELWREQGAEVSAGLKTEAAIERLVDWLKSMQRSRTPEDVGNERRN
jgi:mono/diheme cytochrome c family protein